MPLLNLRPCRGRTRPLSTSTVRALSETSALGKGCEAICAGGGITVLPLPGTSWGEQQYSGERPRSSHGAAPRGHTALTQSASATYRGAPQPGTPKPPTPHHPPVKYPQVPEAALGQRHGPTSQFSQAEGLILTRCRTAAVGNVPAVLNRCWSCFPSSEHRRAADSSHLSGSAAAQATAAPSGSAQLGQGVKQGPPRARPGQVIRSRAPCLHPGWAGYKGQGSPLPAPTQAGQVVKGSAPFPHRG